MDKLKQFNDYMKQWIVDNSLNVDISGSATVATREGDYYLNISLIHKDEAGPIPPPSKENLGAIYQTLAKLTNEYSMIDVSYIEFLMAPDKIGKRWQISYSFRN